MLFRGARLLFLGGCCGRLYDHSARRRCNHDHGLCTRGRTCRRLGNHRSAWRTRCNSRCSRRTNNRRRRARLRYDLARRRSGRCCRSGGCRLRSGRSRFCWRYSHCRSCRLGSNVRMARLLLFFFLLGQNCLQHIARLGNVREVNLRRNRRSRIARRCCAGVSVCACAWRKMRTYLVCLILLQ